MWYLLIITMATMAMGSMAYIPAEKDHFFTDVLLREVVDRMGKDLADAADAYLDFPENNRLPVMGARSAKDMETEEQLFPIDYDSLGEPNSININPSIRDQEYLQHSTLWGSQYMSGGAGEGKQRLKPEGTMLNRQEVKTDSSLPAYCNPPNPCPVGYTEDQGCTNSMEFENTAAFSRRYQSSQDCMCDSEHMFDCPNQSERSHAEQMPDSFGELDFDRFLQQTFKNNQMSQHRSVAKKFYIMKSENQNPYLLGERLPVAAKKGNHIY